MVTKKKLHKVIWYFWRLVSDEDCCSGVLSVTVVLYQWRVIRCHTVFKSCVSHTKKTLLFKSTAGHIFTNWGEHNIINICAVDCSAVNIEVNIFSTLHIVIQQAISLATQILSWITTSLTVWRLLCSKVHKDNSFIVIEGLLNQFPCY